MKISEKLCDGSELSVKHLSAIKNRYRKLSRISEFESDSFGPAHPDQVNVDERRSKISGPVLKRASTNPRQGKWLASIAACASSINEQPINLLELGTCVGISAMYLMAGMATGKGGHLTTFEGSPELAELAKSHIDEFLLVGGIENITYDVVVGPIDVTLYKWLRVLKHSLDVAFIDGNHQKEPTIAYHKALQPHMNKGGIFVHDDISWGEGMQQAWHTIQELEPDAAKIEFYLGGRPGRGLIYRSESPQIGIERIDFDSSIERLARKLKARIF